MNWHKSVKQGWYLLLGVFFMFISTTHAQENGIKMDNLYPFPQNKEVKLSDTGIIMRLINRSMVLKRRNVDSAIILLKAALNESVQKKVNDGIAISLLGLGTCYSEVSRFNESVACLKQARYFCENSVTLKNRLMLLYYNDLAVPYAYQMNYDTALYFYNKALTQMEQYHIVDTDTRTMIYSNIGGIWLNNEEYDKAIYYLKKGESIARKGYPILAQIYLNICAAYDGKEKYDSCYYYANKALQLGEKNKDMRTQRTARADIGNYYNKIHMPAKAIPYFEEVLSDLNTSPYDRISAYSNMGYAYFDLKEYERAKECAENIIQLSTAYGIKNENYVNALDLYEMVYGATGQYKKAYDYVCQTFKLRDSLMYGQRSKGMRVLELRYKTAEKDKELAQQQSLLDNKQLLISQQQGFLKAKNIWIGSIAGGMLLLIALLASVYISNNRKRALQNNQILLLQQGNDIDNLKAMIKGEENERLRMARELHDGISSQLAAVKINFGAIQRKYHDLIYDSNFSNGIEQLKDILTELRKTAHNLSPDILTEGGLPEALRVFCNKISASTNIDIIFQQYGTTLLLDYDFELTIYRMVQELVQNIVKHANATKALVQLDIEDDILSITVEDNGTGMAKDRLQSAEGMGLRQIRNRVTSMGGKLDIQTNENEGTAVYIEYNITTNKRQS